MVALWQSLTNLQQITFVLACASTLIIVVDFVLFLVNFYGIDRLNAEAINLNRYEVVANNDSDMSKDTTPRLISIKSLNIFLAVSCWLCFSLYHVLSLTNLIIVSVVFGMYCACLDQLFLRFVRNM